MAKINTFDIEIQADEIASIHLKGDGSDWYNDIESDDIDEDDADCINF